MQHVWVSYKTKVGLVNEDVVALDKQLHFLGPPVSAQSFTYQTNPITSDDHRLVTEYRAHRIEVLNGDIAM
jgi:hypothetical protein